MYTITIIATITAASVVEAVGRWTDRLEAWGLTNAITSTPHVEVLDRNTFRFSVSDGANAEMNGAVLEV